MAMPIRRRGPSRACLTAKPWHPRMFLLAIVSFLAVSADTASAATFGTQQVVAGLRVRSIFKGHFGAIYVTFSPSSLTGCNGSYGGYLTSTWSEALVGEPADANAPSMQLSILLTAKTTDAPVEVRYRVNTSGTGWDKCTIDAIWLQ